MEEKTKQLKNYPEDWELRRAIAQHYYEERQFEEAAGYLLDAPEIPGDEVSVVFAATILGRVDPENGHAILDQFLEEHGNSSAVFSLKAKLLEVQEMEASELEELHSPGEHDESHADHLPSETASLPSETASLPSETASEAPVIKHTEAFSGEEIEDAGIEHAHEIESEGRSFIVSEGEAVHAADKESAAGNKLGSFAIALLVNVLILFALSLKHLVSVRSAPPQVTVSSVANPEEIPMDPNKMVTPQKSAASTKALSMQIVSATAVSRFAMPELTVTDGNIAMVSASVGDSGFGMSMSGFGDVSNMGGIPVAMRSRCSMSQRMKRLRESGGEDRAERAVRNGLEFLAKHQDKDGAIGADYKAGITGLALLAFLGHCETPESPKLGDTVVNATMYLINQSKKNKGWISANKERRTHDIYEHAIGIYALSELYTMTKESGTEIPNLESVLKRSVSKLTSGQTRRGGWAYSNNSSGRDDGSISMWCFQALKAAHNTGIKFSRVDKALDRMVDKYIPANQDSAGVFKYSMSDGQGRNSLTAAGLLGLQLWGKKDSEEFKKGFATLNKKLASNPYSAVGGGFPYYAPYYNTQVFFMHEGKEWKNYNKKFQPELLDAQNKDGSWFQSKSGGIAGADSQLMNTAWAILMLEVYYRYLPTTDKVKDLKVR